MKRQMARKRTRTRRSNGFVVYDGPSEFDDVQIVVIVTGVRRASVNSKTGRQLQTWIMLRDVHPYTGVVSGADGSICGSCHFRHAYGGGCYVGSYVVASVWKTYQKGRYPPVNWTKDAALFKGKAIRLGSYGDPCAVPLKTWLPILAATAKHTGYTHAWRRASETWRSLLMASVENPLDAEEAHAAGWRTFRVRRAGAHVMTNETVCPASKEAGHRTTCEHCGRCDGTRRGDHRASIVIEAHGALKCEKRIIRSLAIADLRAFARAGHKALVGVLT